MENEFDLENISQKIDMVNQKLAQLESKSLEIEKRQDVIDSLAYAYLFRAEMVLSKVNTVKEIEILQQLHKKVQDEKGLESLKVAGECPTCLEILQHNQNEICEEDDLEENL